ncbi:MAG: hypothetical protein Q9173_001130 [Seirophora scorigena]
MPPAKTSQLKKKSLARNSVDYAYSSRFVFLMDGNAWSGRYYTLLRSGSTAPKQCLFCELSYQWTKSWVHYISIGMDAAELAGGCQLSNFYRLGAKHPTTIGYHNGTSDADMACIQPGHYSTFLIDVYSLGETAFTTANAAGLTLKSILESDSAPKVFFDVRNDADALYAHFGIQLQGVYDVQLMENASRCFSKAKLIGLAHCIEYDSGLGQEAKMLWKSTKQSGLELFAPEHGGSYEVFNIRPLPQDIIDYCTQDVIFLPVLYRLYSKKLDKYWTKKVFEETCKRVTMALSVEYDPRGKDKVWSPWAPKTGKNALPVKGSKRAAQRSYSKFPSPDTKLVTEAMNENHEATKAKSRPAPADAGPFPISANSKSSTDAELGYYPSFAVPRCELQLRSRSLPFSSAGFLVTIPPNIVSKREKWTCMICSQTMGRSQRKRT